jgi:hypothetical protein
MVGTTTNNWATVYEKDGNGNALIEVASIKNTGIHNMSIKITVEDLFTSVQATDTANLAPNQVWKEDTFHGFAPLQSIATPYTYWKIEVQSQTNGNPTTFEMKAAG